MKFFAIIRIKNVFVRYAVFPEFIYLPVAFLNFSMSKKMIPHW